MDVEEDDGDLFALEAIARDTTLLAAVADRVTRVLLMMWRGIGGQKGSTEEETAIKSTNRAFGSGVIAFIRLA